MNNLSMYVPHIWKSELDSEATAFLSKYYPDAIKTPMCVPIEKIATEIMHLKVVEHHLSEDLSILGQILVDHVFDKIPGNNVIFHCFSS